MNVNLAWASAADFFAMGGYGLYVWGSFGVTALLLALECGVVGAQRRGLLRDGARMTDADGSPPSPVNY